MSLYLTDTTHIYSPAGDQRENAVPCQRCRNRRTWNICGYCERCTKSCRHPHGPRSAEEGAA